MRRITVIGEARALNTTTARAFIDAVVGYHGLAAVGAPRTQEQPLRLQQDLAAGRVVVEARGGQTHIQVDADCSPAIVKLQARAILGLRNETVIEEPL